MGATQEADLAELAAARCVPGWRVVEYHAPTGLAGFGMLRGTELHCHLFPKAGFHRAAMRAFLQPLFERHGFLTTRVPVSDLANQRFNRLFGFVRTWSDAKFHYFLMAELPFGKEHTCL